MVYQALYRKYRPKSFNDFIDQDNVKKILQNSIKNNKLSHAYLFAGPRGIGKTSMAKIFAKAVNCMDFNKKNDVCDKCDNCIECNNNPVDIIEIDAASNNGVDQIRELKNKINIVPSVLNYKVYIIDEVHMLTNSAFNALLKTLEEPPSYVIFILATTEFYAVPETIVSRCQCFNFSRISNDSLVKRLKFIADEEKINVDNDTLLDIALFSNGGLRDAIGVLDKLNSFTNGNITRNDFETINNLVSYNDITLTYESIKNSNTDILLKLLEKINNNGFNFNNYIEQLMKYIRDQIINSFIDKTNNEETNKDIEIIKELDKLQEELKHSLNPYILTQICFLKLTNINNVFHETNNNFDENNKKNISREIKKENISREIINEKKEIKKLNNEEYIVNEEVKANLINNALASANKQYKDKLVNDWDKLREYFDIKKYSKASQLLNDTYPMVASNKYLILTTDVQAIIDNINKKFTLCEELIKKITNDNIRIVIILNSEFDQIKNKYIADKKQGIKYEIVNEDRSLIEKQNTDLVSKAISLFGEDLVDIE